MYFTQKRSGLVLGYVLQSKREKRGGKRYYQSNVCFLFLTKELTKCQPSDWSRKYRMVGRSAFCVLSYRCKASRTISQQSRLVATNTRPCTCTVCLYVFDRICENVCPPTSKQDYSSTVSTATKRIPVTMIIQCIRSSDIMAKTATQLQ